MTGGEPMPPVPKKKRDPRMALRTSATLATVFTILGQAFFGFEQSVLQVFVCVLTGHTCAFLFEWVDAKASGDVPNFAGGGWKKALDWSLSAQMTSITLSFLMFYNRQLWICAFTVAAAIGSKYVFRVRSNGRLQHFMNPSNFAIALVLSTYTWVGVLPWSWTTNIHGVWDAAVPIAILLLGLRLNLLFTNKLPLIVSWLGGFIVQGVIRSWRLDVPMVGQLVPLTGVSMMLFTMYMITDPQTSPSRVRSQIIFGASIALAYSIYFDVHLQYTLFYAVATVCALRGVVLYISGKREPKTAPVAMAAVAGSFSESAPVAG